MKILLVAALLFVGTILTEAKPIRSGSYNSKRGLIARDKVGPHPLFGGRGNMRRDDDSPGNENLKLQDRDYSFLFDSGSNGNSGSSNGGGLWDDDWPPKKKRILAKSARERDVDHPGNEEVQLKDRDYGFLNSGAYGNGGGGSSSGGLWDDNSWPLMKRWLQKSDKAEIKRDDDHPGNEEVQLKDRDYGFLNSGAYGNGGGGSSSGGLWDDNSWPLMKRWLQKSKKAEKERDVEHPGNEEVQLKDRDYGFLNSGAYSNGGGGSSSGGLWGDNNWPLKRRV